MSYLRLAWVETLSVVEAVRAIELEPATGVAVRLVVAVGASLSVTVIVCSGVVYAFPDVSVATI